jgi:hypothetical protein
MVPLSYGYKLPQSLDFGSTFFPALEYNITRLNSHNHDGTNSANLTTTSFTITPKSILATAWNDIGGGMYSQTVQMGGAMTWDGRNVSFRKLVTGEILYLEAEKVGVASFKVYTNDNTLNAIALFV